LNIGDHPIGGLAKKCKVAAQAVAWRYAPGSLCAATSTLPTPPILHCHRQPVLANSHRKAHSIAFVMLREQSEQSIFHCNSSAK
jgi:hypothetical protein